MQLNVPEPDDDLHNPAPNRDRQSDKGGSVFTARGFANLGCLFILGAAIIMLFAGFPILTHFLTKTQTTQGGFNLGGINATGQIADIPGNWGLIDRDTPKSAYTKKNYHSNDEWVLVFSDEFNLDGRTFYPGDDPYWEAVDLHYWGTVRSDAQVFRGWPYTYDHCDVGTLPNQTYPGTQLPLLAVTQGDKGNGGELSFLPGQRLSACTCPGESHPGPVRADGSYVGRASPEIDIFEAIVADGVGQVSLSSQWAPFNAMYDWFNTTDNYEIYNPNTVLNEYKGGGCHILTSTLRARKVLTGSAGVFQQTTSGLALTNQDCYERVTGCYAIFGFQYKPGFDNAYISWINDGKLSWTVRSGGLKADARVEIFDRPVPQEPMYIIANLGFSLNFGGIDFENIKLPATMSVDYIRVYQPADAQNIGCDPKEFPTAAYINTCVFSILSPPVARAQLTDRHDALQVQGGIHKRELDALVRLQAAMAQE
ncbi:hypothetical protein DXG03_003036 [Asterophora parasitica]|uniref:Glycoside hydrolase family 16 protein n=1 Tax=Asterophora parasitica TaxID=117018 RepID=A0A9P7G7V0_9AGAR|nr:hypothetical protein DXG03_003036 [Asterophora parasitica]